MRKVGRFHPPDRDVLKDITLAFYPGAKIGVLGSNGAGKSTLLRIMAGLDDGFTGEARLTDGFTVGLLEQEPTLDESMDVQGNVMEAVGEVAGLLARYEEVLAGWGEPDADFERLGEDQAALEKRIEAAGAWDLQRNIEIAMDALRLPPGDADVTTLSGGERRRVALCRLLLSRPDLLLLDEPTNHLDAESVAWLERTLRDYAGTVVAITHDRYFLDNVAGWILELDHGRGIPYEGNYSGWLEQKRAVWTPRRRPTRHVGARWTASWNGFAWHPGPARPRARPGWPPTTASWQKPLRAISATGNSRSRFPPTNASATRWSRWTASPRDSATTC